MRRAYVEAHADLPESFDLARAWAGRDSMVTIVGPSTSDVDASPYLAKAGLPIGTTSNRHSKYTARPRSGTVIAWCLHLDEILDLERYADLDGLVAVRAHNSHAPWTTAHDAECLGGKQVASVPEPTDAIKAMVTGLSVMPVLNQGLIDSRERSMAVQALTYMRRRGHKLIPEQLIAEAIRQKWPGSSSLEFGDLAKQLNAGKRFRFQDRVNLEAMAEWDRA